MVTQRVFERTARILRGVDDVDEKEWLVKEFSSWFKEENSQFSRVRFRRAVYEKGRTIGFRNDEGTP